MIEPPPDADRPMTDAEPSGRPTIRSPIATVVAAVIVGILADRWLNLTWSVWTVTAVGLVMATLFAARFVPRRPAMLATWLLLGGCVVIGGLRHHLAFSTVAADDVNRLTRADSRPIHIVGIVESPVTVVTSNDSAMTPPWMRIDRSMCDLRCEAVVDGERRIALSGRARLVTTGHLLHVNVGDRVDVVGELTAPRGPSNPGAFDYRQHLRRQGVRCLIGCNHPNGVRVLQPGVTGHVSRWRSKLRSECEAIFVQHLDRRTVPLAVSLLLGERGQLPGDVRSAFAESGTMHLLAISGLHVGILAGLLLVGCRLLNLSVVSTTLVLLIGIGTYAFVTNLRPPVVRASVLAVVAAAGWPAYRRLGAVNLIAVCALAVLLINPTDLFDVGTQLSFLAVIAIGWAAAFIGRMRRRGDESGWLLNPFVRREGVMPTLVRWLAEGYVVTAAIWLFTLPLTTAQFHIAAPVGFVINVLLIPYVTLLLGLGFGTLACGFLLPWLVRWPAMLFDMTLEGLLEIVEASSAWHLGHVYLSGPPLGWLVVFYGLLGLTLILQRRLPKQVWSWSVVWGWVIVGQLASFAAPQRESLRCTFLNVGHGCCVLIELPGDKTLLYDAGMLSGDRRGLRVIQSALWARGVHRLNGIITSHADVDHFNVAAGLMRTMPVGTLLCSRSFLDFDQQPVALLCDAAAQEAVPQRLMHGGDRIATDVAGVTLRILHPDDGWQSKHDNANSIVLQITFAGRTILLTGDLEADGLMRLLSRNPVDADVLMSPHHGSPAANPRSLADWADPRFVIVSGGSSQKTGTMQSAYPLAEGVFCTHDDGAVTVEIAADGTLSVTPFVDVHYFSAKTPM